MGGSGRGWAGPEDVTCPDDLLDLDAGNVNLLGEVPQGHPGVLVGQGVDVQLPTCHRNMASPGVPPAPGDANPHPCCGYRGQRHRDATTGTVGTRGRGDSATVTKGA